MKSDSENISQKQSVQPQFKPNYKINLDIINKDIKESNTKGKCPESLKINKNYSEKSINCLNTRENTKDDYLVNNTLTQIVKEKKTKNNQNQKNCKKIDTRSQILDKNMRTNENIGHYVVFI